MFDDFLFPQVRYVIVPWRVVACVIVHKQSEIRTLEKRFEIFRMTSFLHFFCIIIQPIPPRQSPKTCVGFIAFMVQCSMNCQQPFLIVVLTSNNTGVLFTVGKTGKSWEDQCPETWDPKITTLGKADQSLGQNHLLEGQKPPFGGEGIFDPGFFGVQKVSKGCTPEV